MALQKREKTLVYVAGGLLAVLVPLLLSSGLGGGGGNSAAERDNLQDEVDQKTEEMKLLDGSNVVATLANLQKRSLPSDKELATSDYQAWLRSLVDHVEFDAVERISSSRGQNRPGIYESFTFSVKCRGTLEELTEFLDEFYAVDYLHKITRLEMTPNKESEVLELRISIEAMSLPEAVRKTLPLVHVALEEESPRARPQWLTLDKDAYSEAIVQRPMEEAESPEEEARTVPGGLFAMYREKEKLIVVVDEPDELDEPDEPDEPEPPPFDYARHTNISGIVFRGGRPEVWIRIRTTDESLIRHVGETFEAGSVRAKVTKIDLEQSCVEIEEDGRLRTLKLGDFLIESVELSSN